MPKTITRRLEFIQFLTDSRPIDSLPGRPYLLAAWKVSANGLSLDPWESDSIFNAFDSFEKFEFYFIQSDRNNLGYVLYSEPDQIPPNLLPPTPTPTATSTPTPTPTPTSTLAPYFVITSPSNGVSPAQFGVVLVSEPGNSISFNHLYDFSGLPANMNIYISNVQVATVTFTYPYFGMPFVFTIISNGLANEYRSTFVGSFNAPGRVDFYLETPTPTPTSTVNLTPTPTNTPTSLPSVAYPVRAVHVGGVVRLAPTNQFFAPTVNIGGTYGDLRVLSSIEDGETISVDIGGFFDGQTINYASLEVALVDSNSRIVGWGSTRTGWPDDGLGNPPTNGAGGTYMNLTVGQFPTVTGSWVLNGKNPAFSAHASYEWLPVEAYKIVDVSLIPANTITPTPTPTNTPTPTPTSTPTPTRSEQYNTEVHISYDDLGNEYLQVSNAYPVTTNGGVATSQLRTIYKFAPDSGSSPSYTGSAWPYVFIQGVLQIDSGISATITEGTNRHLIVNGRPVYQYVGDTNAGTAGGISSAWPCITSNGGNTTNAPVGVLTLNAPTPTNTPTATNTPTITPTNTPTATNTPTITPTNTPTATNTPTITPTNTPTATNTPTSTPIQTPTPTPTITPTQLGSNYANYNGVADWNGQDGNVTTVGTNGGPSYYGTFDQSGNVWEWNEEASGTSRVIRGGSWRSEAPSVDFQTFFLSKSYRTLYGASNRAFDMGFRVASSTNPLEIMNFVSVGDESALADNTGYGAVNYEYQISKYPITQSQYVEFLNAVAGTDTYGLYSTTMNSDSRGGITRSIISGSYAYSVRASMGNKPVNFVNWFNCARYCNWLHNGRPSGSQNASTTENGAYSISGTSAVKISGASYWIPKENEWYKAAYFSANKDGGVGYWNYATQSDADPTPVAANIIGDGPFVPA